MRSWLLSKSRRAIGRAGRLAMLVAVAFMIAFPPFAQAGTGTDVGPPAAIATIRHDLPLLLAGYSSWDKPPVVDWVVTDGRDSVAWWHAGRHFNGAVALVHNGGKWWWRGAAITQGGGWTAIQGPSERCGIIFSGPPSGQQFVVGGFIHEAVALHLFDKLPRVAPRPSGEIMECDSFAAGSAGGGYDASFPPFEADFFMTGHAPADWQRPMTPGSTLYYVFYLEARPWYGSKTASELTPQSGRHTAAFSVWFPYVLDRRKTYTLLLSGVAPAFPPVRGTLQDNVLTFQLPPFSLAGQTVHGEIDGI